MYVLWYWTQCQPKYSHALRVDGIVVGNYIGCISPFENDVEYKGMI